MLPSSSSFRNPACKFPCTGLAPQEPALCHHIPLVHASHNLPETIQVTSNVSIGNDHIGVASRQDFPCRLLQYSCKSASYGLLYPFTGVYFMPARKDLLKSNTFSFRSPKIHVLLSIFMKYRCLIHCFPLSVWRRKHHCHNIFHIR